MFVPERYANAARQRQLIATSLKAVDEAAKFDDAGRLAITLSSEVVAIESVLSRGLLLAGNGSPAVSGGHISALISKWLKTKPRNVDTFLELLTKPAQTYNEDQKFWFLCRIPAPAGVELSFKRRDANFYVSFGNPEAGDFSFSQEHKGTHQYDRECSHIVLQGWVKATSESAAADQADQLITGLVGLLNFIAGFGSYTILTSRVPPGYVFFEPKIILLFDESKKQSDLFCRSIRHPADLDSFFNSTAQRKLANLQSLDRVIRHKDRATVLKAFECYQKSLTASTLEEAVLHLWRSIEVITKCGHAERDRIKNRLLTELPEPTRSVREMVFWTMAEARDSYMHSGRCVPIDLQLFDQMRLLADRYLSVALRFNTLSCGALGELVDAMNARKVWGKKLRDVAKVFKVKVA